MVENIEERPDELFHIYVARKNYRVTIHAHRCPKAGAFNTYPTCYSYKIMLSSQRTPKYEAQQSISSFTCKWMEPLE